MWDVRTFKPRHAYFSHAPVDALDISQRGMLALGHGRTVQVRDAQPPPFRQAACQKLALQLVKALGGDAWGTCCWLSPLCFCPHGFQGVGLCVCQDAGYVPALLAHLVCVLMAMARGWSLALAGESVRERRCARAGMVRLSTWG